MEGFPAPQNNRISLGLFLGLLLATSITKPLAMVVLFIMEAALKVMAFLIDGSYISGSLLEGGQVMRIEPWPRVRGHRLSPWIPLAVSIVVYSYWRSGMKDAFDSLVCVGILTFAFFSTKESDSSFSAEIVERLEPVLTKKLHLAYHRESKIFPMINFID